RQAPVLRHVRAVEAIATPERNAVQRLDDLYVRGVGCDRAWGRAFDSCQHRLAARQRRLVEVQLQPLRRPLQLQLVDAGTERKRDLLVGPRVDDANRLATFLDDDSALVAFAGANQVALVGLDAMDHAGGEQPGEQGGPREGCQERAALAGRLGGFRERFQRGGRLRWRLVA